MLPLEEGDSPWSIGTTTPTSTGRDAVIEPFVMAITPIISTTATSTHPDGPASPSTSSR